MSKLTHTFCFFCFVRTLRISSKQGHTFLRKLCKQKLNSSRRFHMKFGKYAPPPLLFFLSFSLHVFRANGILCISTPLTGIMGSLNLLDDTTPSQEQKQLLRVAQLCGEQLMVRSLFTKVFPMSKQFFKISCFLLFSKIIDSYQRRVGSIKAGRRKSTARVHRL